MKGNSKGFSLIEIMLVLFIMGIISAIVLPTSKNLYEGFLLKTTANEIRSALYLAQQFSIDESKDYAFEIFDHSFRVRERVFGGKIVYRQEIDDRIMIVPGYDGQITYNRHGNTSYGRIVLSNRKGEKIKIEVMIGTGRVRVSKPFK